MILADFLNEGVICFLKTQRRNQALQEMTHALKKVGKITNSTAFYEALLKREELVSTGIGMGVALPHAKLEAFDHFFMAIGIQKLKEGIEWQALDQAPVKLIFMIGGPIDRQTEYLQILSKVTTAIKDEKTREALLTSQTREEVLNLFSDH